MADPLSAAVSVLAVMGACAACRKQLNNLLRAVRDAPVEILALSNEINDMSVVLTDVEAIRQGQAAISKLVMYSHYYFKRTEFSYHQSKSNL